MTSTLIQKSLWLFIGLLLTATAVAQPARIILLRHAEKPANESDIHLSERGQQRAHALAGWATNSPAWGTNDQPSAVFACKPTTKARSLRPIETITPLAERLKLNVQTPYPAKDPSALAQLILKDPALKGKTVIICWARDELPELAGCFGVKSGPVKWGKNVFDRFWLITFSGASPELKDRPQRLLADDASR